MSVTEQVKKYAQEATSITPAGFVVEVLRPKKGIEYHADLDTLEDAEAFVKRMEKKKPKWRMTILAMFRWPLDGVFVADQEDDGTILDARRMAFGELLPYIRGAYSVYGWRIAEGALIPPKEHKSHKWAAHWIKVEDKEIRKEAFKIPHWLPRVVEQQREELRCSVAE